MRPAYNGYIGIGSFQKFFDNLLEIKYSRGQWITIAFYWITRIDIKVSTILIIGWYTIIHNKITTLLWTISSYIFSFGIYFSGEICNFWNYRKNSHDFISDLSRLWWYNIYIFDDYLIDINLCHSYLQCMR